MFVYCMGLVGLCKEFSAIESDSVKIFKVLFTELLNIQV